MTARAVVVIALLSALLGAVVTGWVLDRRGARERQRVTAEVADLTLRAQALDAERVRAQARADSLAQVADAQAARADTSAGRARALGHRTAALEAALAGAVTVRDSVDRLVTLADGLQAERDEWRTAAEEARAAWAAEREARGRLGAVVAASDSVRAADRARITALEGLLASERGQQGRWLGLIPVPSRGLVAVASLALGAYLGSR